MDETEVWVFFYGSYMNRAVLAEVDIAPERWETARLPGFELHIAPRANLVRSETGSVYGIVAAATHRELGCLYAHAKDVLGETYLPEAVLVETRDQTYRAALCYICPRMEPRPADPDYVDRIAGPARSYGFPEWYLARIESFKPGSPTESRTP